MHTLDYISISVFAMGILCTGLLFSRSGRSMRNFFSAGGTVPWSMAGLSLFMGFFSAGTFVVWGSIAYSSGLVAVTIQWTMCIAGLLVGLAFAPRWRKTGALTAAEYIDQRLGRQTQKSYTLLFLLVSLFTTGAFLYPVGRILEVSTGLPLVTCILLIGGVSILYVTVGGLRAVVVTDVLQFVILFAAVLIVIPLSFDKVGGVMDFFASVPENFFKPFNSEYTLGFMIAFGLYNMVFLGGNWAYIQRYTTVKNPKDARRTGLLFAGLYSFSPVLWMLPPMIYHVFNPSLSGLGTEGAYLMMCKEALPAGLLGLMIGGMIFATASSLNATLNISAAVFTNDIFRRLFPHSKDSLLVRVARLSTICFGLLAIVVALMIPYMGGAVNVVISVAALTGVPLYLPILWTLFSKRQTGASVLAATLTSLAVNVFFKFISPSLLNIALDREQEMILGVGFPALFLAAYEVWAAVKGKVSPSYLQYAAQHKESAATATEDQVAASKADNRFSARVIGIGITASGAVIILLGAVHEYGRAVVCGMGLLLALLGVYLWIKNNRKKN